MSIRYGGAWSDAALKRGGYKQALYAVKISEMLEFTFSRDVVY